MRTTYFEKFGAVLAAEKTAGFATKMGAALLAALVFAACGSDNLSGIDDQGNSIADTPASSSIAEMPASSSDREPGSNSDDISLLSSSSMETLTPSCSSKDIDAPDVPFNPDLPSSDVKDIDFSGAALDSVYAYIVADRTVHENAPGNCGMPECDYHTVSGNTASGFLSMEEQLYVYTVRCGADFKHMYEVRNDFNVIKKHLETTSMEAVEIFTVACIAENGAGKETVPTEDGMGYIAECEIKISDNPGEETEYKDPVWNPLATEIVNKCHD